MCEKKPSYAINRQMLQTARRQFCLDTCLDWQQYLEHPERKVYIQKTRYATGTAFPVSEGARCYEGKDSFLKAIMCMGQLFLAVDEKLYDWAVEQFGNCEPEWFCEYGNLRKIDEKLKEYGREIADTHVYYLPSALQEEKAPDHFLWYDQQEIMKFQEKNRFTSAICFSPTQPDVLAVVALKQASAEKQEVVQKTFDQEAMAGMAGASEDGAYLWQIGINVVQECAGRGLATELVRSLKEAIIRRGKVPFYGTSESHTISQTVAWKAGFVPAWTEIYTQKVKGDRYGQRQL